MKEIFSIYEVLLNEDGITSNLVFFTSVGSEEEAKDYLFEIVEANPDKYYTVIKEYKKL